MLQTASQQEQTGKPVTGKSLDVSELGQRVDRFKIKRFVAKHTLWDHILETEELITSEIQKNK